MDVLKPEKGEIVSFDNLKRLHLKVGDFIQVRINKGTDFRPKFVYQRYEVTKITSTRVTAEGWKSRKKKIFSVARGTEIGSGREKGYVEGKYKK